MNSMNHLIAAARVRLWIVTLLALIPLNGWLLYAHVYDLTQLTFTLSLIAVALVSAWFGDAWALRSINAQLAAYELAQQQKTNALQQTASALRHAQQTAEQRLTELTASSERIASLQATHHQLVAQLQTREGELAHTNAQLQTAYDESAQLAVQLQTRIRELTQLHGQSEVIRETHTQLENRLEARNAELAQAHAQLTALRNAYAQLATQLQTRDAALAQAHAQLAALQNLYAQLRAHFQTRTQELARLSEQLAALRPTRLHRSRSPVRTAGNDSQPTVLVIDDDATARALITQQMQDAAFKLVLASDGAEGLRLAHELQPDLITLDMLLPQLDGWCVLKALHANPALATIPVILFTLPHGHNGAHDHTAALQNLRTQIMAQLQQ
jgi:CheY-like chemotaxis protein